MSGPGNNDPLGLSTPALSERAFQAYLVEYGQCVECYRHTYATIWQASALFAALSAGMLAFQQSFPNAVVLAPWPLIFWFLGIYRPMNRYAEIRNDRLVTIEKILNAGVSDLEMQHFAIYSMARKRQSTLQRILKLEVLLRPRVVEVVSIFCWGLIFLEVGLIVRQVIS